MKKSFFKVLLPIVWEKKLTKNIRELFDQSIDSLIYWFMLFQTFLYFKVFFRSRSRAQEKEIQILISI